MKNMKNNFKENDSIKVLVSNIVSFYAGKDTPCAQDKTKEKHDNVNNCAPMKY